MRETMIAATGAGLAAPQIGVRPARGHLRIRAQRALSRCRAGALHRAGQSGADAAVRRDRGGLGRMPVGARACAVACRAYARLRYEGFDPQGRPIEREARASMRASSSTNATIWTAFSTRCACATCACSASPTSCFPMSTFATIDCGGTLDAKLLVERRLEPQQRRLVVQPRAVEQEDVLGALAQRVDLGAGDVDVGLGQRVGDPRQQPGPVAGDDLEDVVRALVVGEDADFGRQREMPQVAADAPSAGSSSGGRSVSTRCSSNSM